MDGAEPHDTVQQNGQQAPNSRRKKNKGPGNNESNSDHPEMVPSVQRLFDTASLQITVRGETRTVTETPVALQAEQENSTNMNEDTSQPQLDDSAQKPKRKRNRKPKNTVGEALSNTKQAPVDPAISTDLSAWAGNTEAPAQTERGETTKHDAEEKPAARAYNRSSSGDSSKSWSDVRANNPKVLRGKQLKESIYYEAKPRRKEMLEQQHESLRYEPVGEGTSSEVSIEKINPSDRSGSQHSKGAENNSGQKLENKTAGKRGNREDRPRESVIQQFTEEYTQKVGVRYIVELDDDHIRLLRKKSLKFPDARFFCQLCEYHVATGDKMEEHRIGDGHTRRKRLKTGNALLRHIPAPTAPHLQALTDYLESFYETIALSDQEMSMRKSVVDELEKDIQQHTEILNDVTLQVCGSVRAGFALNSSDTNIRIIAPRTANLALVMTGIRDTLQQCDEKYCDVITNFGAKQPYVSFHSPQASGDFILKFSEEGNQITNMLLCCYSRYNTKLKQLAVLFKYLAKICSIDDSDKGVLFPYCYPLLAVYYLQQKDLIPVFFRDVNLEAKSEAEFQGEIDKFQPPNPVKEINESTLGYLWLDMLKFYCLNFNIEAHAVSIMCRRIVSKSTKQWNTKRLAIEDPGIPKRNICKNVSHQRVFDFIQDQLRTSYQYFAIPQLESGPAFNKLLMPEITNGKKTTKAKTQDLPNQTPKSVKKADHRADPESKAPAEQISESLGKLDLNSETSGSMEKDDKASDMVTESTNNEETTAKDETPSEEVSIVVTTDSNPTENEQISHKSSSNVVESDQQQNDSAMLVNKDALASSSPKTSAKQPESPPDHGSSTGVDQTHSQSTVPTSEESQIEESKEVEVEDVEVVVVEDSEPPTDELHKAVYDPEYVASLKAEDYNFDFHSDHLTVSKSEIPIFCRGCSKSGHLTDDCPDEQLPACVPLPPPSAKHREILSNVLTEVKEQMQMNSGDNQVRDYLLEDIIECIRNVFPEASLTLYGSSRNGFGNAKSDVDICMTLDEVECIDPSKTVDIIYRLSKCLHRLPQCNEIVPLAHAKVPIVKFRSTKYNLEGDISLYNILAQRNTLMLYKYSQVDERVRTLGYTVKEFAKQCDMGDASRGSLSSYAYIILMIYYLQQCDPPVLPVLQELYEGERPVHIVEDWDTWFFEGSNKELQKVWPGFGKNTQDVAQLWYGFLNFYAQKFDFKTNVVTIRMHRSMTKFEKLWNSDMLAIEDPFDLKRNLGSALSKKMNAFILGNFIKARTIFMSTVEEIPSGYMNWYKYFFNNKDIMQSAGAPNDRGCRICGKIGHLAKACPVVQNRKDRSKKLKEKRLAEAKRNAQENREMERRHSGRDRGSTSSDNATMPNTPPRPNNRGGPQRGHNQNYRGQQQYGSPHQYKQRNREQHGYNYPHRQYDTQQNQSYRGDRDRRQVNGGHHQQQQQQNNGQQKRNKSGEYGHKLAFPESDSHQHGGGPMTQQGRPMKHSSRYSQQQAATGQTMETVRGPVPPLMSQPNLQGYGSLTIHNSSLPASYNSAQPSSRR